MKVPIKMNIINYLYIPGSVLGSGDILVSKINSVPASQNTQALGKDAKVITGEV